MKISVFGLGYVGAVSAGCLTRSGHSVVGVDPYLPKVELINNGKSPVIEQEIDTIIADAVADGKLSATTHAGEAIHSTELSLICVGTPSQANGSLDLRYVRKVCEEIGSELKRKKDYHVVVARSTMLPGSMDEVVIPTLESCSGKKAGKDFGVCFNPEFLREGTAVFDFFHPPKTVIGEDDERGGDMVAELYVDVDAPLVRVDINTAEMVKYADNVWHALKVCFANELGNICKGVGIDSHRVMEIFCKDNKLNLSPYYLKPGFAFGGSCLPKDVRALTYKARSLDLTVPVIESIMDSNEYQVRRGLNLIQAHGSKKVGVLGFSFKEGTDDLRESPIVEVIERLIGKGYELRLYDRNVDIASLVGANRDFILNQIPHISKLMVSNLDDVLAHADIVVIGNKDKEFNSIASRIGKHQFVVDLVRIGSVEDIVGKYEGICW